MRINSAYITGFQTMNYSKIYLPNSHHDTILASQTYIMEQFQLSKWCKGYRYGSIAYNSHDIQRGYLINRTIHLPHMPPYTILERNVHISVVTGLLRDMGQKYCGIWEIGTVVPNIWNSSSQYIWTDFCCIVLYFGYMINSYLMSD